MHGNVKQVVPFFHVADMERSIRYYVDGLGFTIQQRWDVDGQLRWCYLSLGGASLMLQTFAKRPSSELGAGVSIVFFCEDALAIYHQLIARGIAASEPQVGNAMWVTSLTDPDGYRIVLQSGSWP